MPITMTSSSSIEDQLQHHALTQSLRSEGYLSESRYYQNVPKSMESEMFTVGSLLGPDKLPVRPLAFHETGGASFYLILYIGAALAGYPGMIHGGPLATIMDEGMAGCASAALPKRVAVTLGLNVQYRKAAPTESFYVLKARVTKVENNAAWVESRLEILDGQEKEAGEVVTEAWGHYLQPAVTGGLYSPI
ncbi:PaaI family thioesterase [Aspergillus affinis]|uniref:PaaI family thioesterase n=1 Tax=Aspergillus affinis TaxID=1070780 RepID=UPI0022FF4367|nr:HotDog domain-containing protein [Aspergillus affinis]KAI9045130.1 HotDog domain-containing protein [Aspergillus affinis]